MKRKAIPPAMPMPQVRNQVAKVEKLDMSIQPRAVSMPLGLLAVAQLPVPS
jgi:hypothetical protein